MSNKKRQGKRIPSGSDISMMSFVSGSRHISTAGSRRSAASKTLHVGQRQPLNLIALGSNGYGCFGIGDACMYFDGTSAQE